MKDEIVEVRFTPEENAAVRDAAGARGLSVPAFVKSAALETARQGTLTQMDFTLAHTLLDQGSDLASFRMVLEGSRSVPAPPDFMFGNVPGDVLETYFRHQWVHPAGVLELDATLRWPYLLSCNGSPISAPWANLHGGHLVEVWHSSHGEEQQVGPDHVLICGPGYPIFGHWTVDFLPKLYLLQAAGHDISALHFILPEGTPEFGRELLRLCGISDGQFVPLRRSDAIRGRILVPTTVHTGVRGPAFAGAAEFLNERIGITPDRTGARLFLSRANAPQSRPCRNREAIERIATDFGLSLVYPEALPLIDQIRLMAGASLVAGECGSALHSTLFSAPGTVVCGIRGSLYHPGFAAIGRALRQPTGYVFGETDLNDPAQGFMVPDNAFRACLEAILDAPSYEGCPAA